MEEKIRQQQKLGYYSVNAECHPTKRTSTHREQRKWRREIVKEIMQENVPELKWKSLWTTGPNLVIKWHPHISGFFFHDTLRPSKIPTN